MGRCFPPRLSSPCLTLRPEMLHWSTMLCPLQPPLHAKQHLLCLYFLSSCWFFPSSAVGVFVPSFFSSYKSFSQHGAGWAGGGRYLGLQNPKEVPCAIALLLLPGAFCGGQQGPPRVPPRTDLCSHALTTPLTLGSGSAAGRQSWGCWGGRTAPAMPRAAPCLGKQEGKACKEGERLRAEQTPPEPGLLPGSLR